MLQTVVILKVPLALENIKKKRQDFSSHSRFTGSRSRLGLENIVSVFLSLVSVSEKSISRILGLVSVSETNFLDISVSFWSRKFGETLVLVSSWSRDIDQAWYRSRLGLEKSGLV